MSTAAAPGTPESAGPRFGTTSVQAVRVALAALVKEGRHSRLYAGGGGGGAEGVRRFQGQYVGSVREALQEMPAILLDVATDGIYCMGEVVLEATDRRNDLVETLYAEGVRGISIETGVDEEELALLAGILGTAWGQEPVAAPAGGEERTIESAIFDADFAHVYFEVVERMGDKAEDEGAESVVVRSILGLVAEINARAGDAATARMRQDEFAVFLRLRDQVAEAQAVVTALRAGMSAALSAEVDRCRAGRDLDDIDIGRMLATCVAAEKDPARANVLAGALLHYLVTALEESAGRTEVLHRAVELLDEEFTPDLRHRELVLAATRSLGEDPLRARLARVLEQLGESAGRGPAFTLFGLVTDEAAICQLAEVLSPWALRVLADTVILREGFDTPSTFDLVRRRLLATEPGVRALGLAMAARMEDVRLVEPLLAHAGSEDPRVPLLLLLALRRHHTPRIVEFVHQSLRSADLEVRLEALRHAVAFHDVAVGAQLRTRLSGDSLAGVADVELRAWCIALARIQREAAEPLLAQWALGERAAHHPSLPRYALHGLRAMNTAESRAALDRIAEERPGLRDEIARIVAGVAR
jgi:hypothetical protein